MVPKYHAAVLWSSKKQDRHQQIYDTLNSIVVIDISLDNLIHPTKIFAVEVIVRFTMLADEAFYAVVKKHKRRSN